MESNLDLDKIFNDIRFELSSDPPSSDEIKDGVSTAEKKLRKAEEIEERLNSNYQFLNNSLSNKIDADIQKMRFELNKTYEIFKNTAETLESIQFSNLRNRIKDLHMYLDDKELEKIVLDSADKTIFPN